MGMVINNSPPCKDCTDRDKGCHSSCAGYSQWKKELEEKKTLVYGERKRTSMLDDFYAENVRKQIKRTGRKI